MKRIYRTLLAALALGLAAYVADGQAEELPQTSTTPNATMPYQVPPAGLAQRLAPGEINGRPDWDVDYPSQLAPQGLQVSDASSTSTPDAKPRPETTR